MKNVSDEDVEGKKVLVRSDLNLPIEENRPVKNLRLERYSESIKELSDRGAKVVLMAHQGRPGDKDFMSLENHVSLLEKEIGKEVKFIASFFGQEPEEKIEEMTNGDIALFENARFLSEELRNETVEKHSENIFVKKLQRHFDLFVNDAFSVAHRPHGSMMGFMKNLETCAGPLMAREIKECSKARDAVENPVLVLGGAKPADLVKVLENMIEKAEKVLLGGIPGEIALKLKGKDLEKKYGWIKERGLNEGEKEFFDILKEHEDKFVLPVDIRNEKGKVDVEKLDGTEMVWDIGPETAEKYRAIIRSAESVIMKGPMGAYEEGYREGSLSVLKAVTLCNGFTLLGGGHTSTLLSESEFSVDDFSHVSIAGGAFVRFMSGEQLPVISALEKYS